MPLSGGEADKPGNRYEGRWTIHCMIDVMDEKADSIRIESPGEDAFEFFLWRDGKQEYHQVKRQHSQLGHWTKNLDFNTLKFQTAKDLYDQFWDYKQKELRKKLDRDIKWTQVIDIICDRFHSPSIKNPFMILLKFQYY